MAFRFLNFEFCIPNSELGSVHRNSNSPHNAKTALQTRREAADSIGAACLGCPAHRIRDSGDLRRCRDSQ